MKITSGAACSPLVTTPYPFEAVSKQLALSKQRNMRWLLQLSRVAFICNVFFILSVSLQVSNWLHNSDVTSFILITGFFLGALFNPLVNLCYLLLFVIRKKFWNIVPSWLITANILFLVMQVFYILYLNDTRHP